MGVAAWFQNFCSDISIGSAKRSTISTRYLKICQRLNIDFWNVDTTSGGRHIGSYGRGTANHWVSDIDMLFELPSSTYSQYDSYIGNGQSALLQAVKNSVARTYSSTSLRGDGQIVQVRFADGMMFELLPTFKNTDGSYTFPDSNSGGSWKVCNPVPEISSMTYGDGVTNNNLKRLCRMARSWKWYCSVPIKGILLDTLAYRFLVDWPSRDKSYLYYDWMSRDFFEYLKNQSSTQSTWYAVGSQRMIYNPENFRYKATVAYNKAADAIKYASDGKEWSARRAWGEIYGHVFQD